MPGQELVEGHTKNSPYEKVVFEFLGKHNLLNKAAPWIVHPKFYKSQSPDWQQIEFRFKPITHFASLNDITTEDHTYFAHYPFVFAGKQPSKFETKNASLLLFDPQSPISILRAALLHQSYLIEHRRDLVLLSVTDAEKYLFHNARDLYKYALSFGYDDTEEQQNILALQKLIEPAYGEFVENEYYSYRSECGRLGAKVEEKEKENEALRAKVEALEKQLSTTDQASSAAASGPNKIRQNKTIQGGKSKIQFLRRRIRHSLLSDETLGELKNLRETFLNIDQLLNKGDHFKETSQLGLAACCYIRAADAALAIRAADAALAMLAKITKAHVCERVYEFYTNQAKVNNPPRAWGTLLGLNRKEILEDLCVVLGIKNLSEEEKQEALGDELWQIFHPNTSERKNKHESEEERSSKRRKDSQEEKIQSESDASEAEMDTTPNDAQQVSTSHASQLPPLPPPGLKPTYTSGNNNTQTQADISLLQPPSDSPPAFNTRGHGPKNRLSATDPGLFRDKTVRKADKTAFTMDVVADNELAKQQNQP